MITGIITCCFFATMAAINTITRVLPVVQVFCVASSGVTFFVYRSDCLTFYGSLAELKSSYIKNDCSFAISKWCSFRNSSLVEYDFVQVSKCGQAVLDHRVTISINPPDVVARGNRGGIKFLTAMVRQRGTKKKTSLVLVCVQDFSMSHNAARIWS